MAFPRNSEGQIDMRAFFLLSEEMQIAAMVDLYDHATDEEVLFAEQSIEQRKAELAQSQTALQNDLSQIEQKETDLAHEKQQATLLFQANMQKTMDANITTTHHSNTKTASASKTKHRGCTIF